MSIDFEQLKKDIDKQTLSQTVKDLRRETRNLNKLKTNLKIAPEENKEQLQTYIEKLREKIDFILNAMTKEKAEKLVGKMKKIKDGKLNKP